MSKLRVHIGHHFFGAGNLGDDLMLAGFLAAARSAFLATATLTCCIDHDRASQRRRFPEVEWLPYDPATRVACIRDSDAWLGLGDTPFQATGGHTWFLDHLCQEAAWCRQYRVPMYYLGVGVNERAAVDYPQTRLLVAQAERLWLRDGDAAALLSGLTVPGQATVHGDLAHLALAGMDFPPPRPGTLGLVLNFEDARQFRPERLAALVAAASPAATRWLAQEVRPLAGAERTLHAGLPPAARAAAPLRVPDYAGAPSARALLADWEGLEALVSSRYHAALVGAWMGMRVAVFARNDKVGGVARQLGLPLVPTMDDPAAVLGVLAAARPVDRAPLRDLAGQVRGACESFFALVNSLSPSRSRRAETKSPPDPAGPAPTPVSDPPSARLNAPARLLLLRPDTYGDLFLFEPVLRLLRRAWPQAEIAVLIREAYRDAAPLFPAEGVRWLTTTCEPYRRGPGADRAALDALRDTVRTFAPDCVVAACAAQTWLEAAVAAFLPDARQVSLGLGVTDPGIRQALAEVVPVDWTRLYPEKVSVEPTAPEWEQNLRLASALTGEEVPRWWPLARVPEAAAAEAARLLAAGGLTPGAFVACAAAGVANVQIKSWPGEHYGEVLAWLERERGVRALLVGHESERSILETVQARARQGGGNPALWLGRAGEMGLLAGLLAAARFYFGNDTGALHLAAALGRPVVSIFGGGHGLRFRPVAAREGTVVQPLPCFGCRWDCHFGDAPCVRAISPESVRRALAEFLDREGEEQRVFEVSDLDPAARAVIDRVTPRLRFLVEDRADRLRQVEVLTAQVNAREGLLATDTRQHERQLADMNALLRESETDRDARRAQVEELTATLRESETDRDARGLEIDGLAVTVTDQDRQIRELTTFVKKSEVDRERQVEELTALYKEGEADRAARLRQVEELTALLTASEADRDARGRQVEELTPLLRESEADRAARGELLGALAAQIRDLDARLGRSGQQVQAQDAQLRARDEQGCTLAEELRAQLARAQALEADLAARDEQVARLQDDLRARGEEAALLTARLTPAAESGTSLPAPVPPGRLRQAWRALTSTPRP